MRLEPTKAPRPPGPNTALELHVEAKRRRSRDALYRDIPKRKWKEMPPPPLVKEEE